MIRFHNVSAQYTTGSEVLKGINCLIKPRSFQFLTGPSGAGKSTFLRLILGDLKAKSGVVTLFNTSVSLMDRDELSAARQRVGVVFQDFRLLDHLTVYQNVALPLYVRGHDERDYRDAVLELLTWVGLQDCMHTSLHTLSREQKQLSAIARALIGKPELLLADEPTENLNSHWVRRLLYLFAELHRLGTSVIIATHDLSLIEHVDATVLVLKEGCLSVSPPQKKSKSYGQAL
jgi:cell division transport system ATP-binding protein